MLRTTSFLYTCHNLYLICHPICKNHCISSCISRNLERIEKSDHKSSNNNFDTRLPNINQSENVATTKTLLIEPNRSILPLVLVSDIWQIGIYDRITYMIDVAHRTRSTSFVNVFIYQFSNFHIFQGQRLDVVWFIVCKPEWKLTHNFLCKNKKVCLYIV